MSSMAGPQGGSGNPVSGAGSPAPPTGTSPPREPPRYAGHPGQAAPPPPPRAGAPSRRVARRWARLVDADLDDGRVGALDGGRVEAGEEGAVAHRVALGEDEGLGVAVGQLGVQPPDLQAGSGQGISATLPVTVGRGPSTRRGARVPVPRKASRRQVAGTPLPTTPYFREAGQASWGEQGLGEVALDRWSHSGFSALGLWGRRPERKTARAWGVGGDGPIGLLQSQQPLLVTVACLRLRQAGQLTQSAASTTSPEPVGGRASRSQPRELSLLAPAPSLQRETDAQSEARPDSHRPAAGKGSQEGASGGKPELPDEPHTGRELLSPGPPLGMRLSSPGGTPWGEGLRARRGRAGQEWPRGGPLVHVRGP